MVRGGELLGGVEAAKGVMRERCGCGGGTGIVGVGAAGGKKRERICPLSGVMGDHQQVSGEAQQCSGQLGNRIGLIINTNYWPGKLISTVAIADGFRGDETLNRTEVLDCRIGKAYIFPEGWHRILRSQRRW